MENDINVIITRFRTTSGRLFQMLYADFDANSKKLDRQKDENVFLQLQGRYLNELEKQLMETAKRILSVHKTPATVRTLHNELKKHISYTISQFAKKTRYT